MTWIPRNMQTLEMPALMTLRMIGIDCPGCGRPHTVPESNPVTRIEVVCTCRGTIFLEPSGAIGFVS